MTGFETLYASQAVWSDVTFGPGDRTRGVCNHIRQELIEVENAPTDLEEWVDVVLLALDGARRATGASGVAFLAAMEAKMRKNHARTWPDWRQYQHGQPINHVRGPDES